MKKVVPWAVFALIGSGIGAVLYFTLIAPQEKESEPIAPDIVEKVFDPVAFLEEFDADGSESVDREEFDARYNIGDFKLTDPGGNVLSGDAAFKALDTNGNRVIDRADLKLLTDKRWRDHQEQTVKRGLVPREWKGRLLALNMQQLRLYEQEYASSVKDQLPFCGQRFDARYFGQWSKIQPERGGEYAGFVADLKPQTSEDAPGEEVRQTQTWALAPNVQVFRVPYDENWESMASAEERVQIREWAAPLEGGVIDGLPYTTWGSVSKGGARAFAYEGLIRREKDALLIAQSQPRIVRVTDAEVTALPDTPYQQYLNPLRQTNFEDVTGNLELARKCRAWGLHEEARTLYMRVLCFEPGNSEALDYWGITVKDGQFTPRKR
jgi:hypothetical protein